MRWTEYGRNPHKRKEYVHQPDFLLVGVDVNEAKHSACHRYCHIGIVSFRGERRLCLFRTGDVSMD